MTARLISRGLGGSDSAGVGGRARGVVSGVTLALGRGLHAVLGAPEDGTLALGELLSGRRAPSSGWLTVDGRPPWKDPIIRRRVAHLSFAPELPDARDVSGAMARAFAARGARDAVSPAEALQAIGAGGLAGRRPSSLTHGEARAVDLAIALAAPDPALVVVQEPFADVTGASDAAIERRLRAASEAGACVVVLTSSPRDASRLADDVLVLERGRVIRGAAAAGEGLLDSAAWPGGRPRRVELVAHFAARDDASAASAARDVARALSDRPAVWAVSWEEPPHGVRAPSSLRVAGPDESACALAILDAAHAVSAELAAMAPVPATLVEVRTATDQLRVAAAWHARAHALQLHAEAQAHAEARAHAVAAHHAQLHAHAAASQHASAPPPPAAVDMEAAPAVAVDLAPSVSETPGTTPDPGTGQERPT